jgi:hypothetical protein
MNTASFSAATCPVSSREGRRVKSAPSRGACSKRCRDDDKHSLQQNLASGDQFRRWVTVLLLIATPCSKYDLRSVEGNCRGPF